MTDTAENQTPQTEQSPASDALKPVAPLAVAASAGEAATSADSEKPVATERAATTSKWPRGVMGKQRDAKVMVIDDGLAESKQASPAAAEAGELVEHVDASSIAPRLAMLVVVRDRARGWLEDYSAIITRVHPDQVVDVTAFPPGAPPEPVLALPFLKGDGDRGWYW